MAESDAIPQGQIKVRRTDGAALGYKRQVSGYGHTGGETGVEVCTGKNKAHAVRSYDTKLAGMSYPPNIFLYLQTPFTDLLSPGRDDNGTADLFFNAFAYYSRNAINRRGDNCKVCSRL
jgi:hypothetical protein